MDQKQETIRGSEDHGVLALGVDSIATAAEKTAFAWFGVWRDVRGEAVQRVNSVIDWIEGMQQGSTRIARAVVQRSDEVASAWIEANERMTLGLVRAVRTTGQGASRLASRTAASLTSTRHESVAQA